MLSTYESLRDPNGPPFERGANSMQLFYDDSRWWVVSGAGLHMGKQTSYSPALVADLWDRNDILFHPDAFPHLTAERHKWTEIEKEQTEFVNSLTEEALGKMLPFRTTHLRLVHLMQHLVKRGQVAVMMRQLDAEPRPTDFQVVLLDCPPSAVMTR